MNTSVDVLLGVLDGTQKKCAIETTLQKEADRLGARVHSSFLLDP